MDKLPILIAQAEPVQNEKGGDYYYRTLTPGRAMSEEENVFIINFTNVHRRKEEIMREADVLILNDVCDPDLLPLIKERKAQKRLTIFEIADDMSAVQPWSPVYFFYRNQENLALSKRLARFSDGIQFSVGELQKLYGYLNPVSIVFPNQMTIVPTEGTSQKDQIVIGWGGSHGHLEDMAQIAPSFVHWIRSRHDVRFHLMGSDPIWTLFNEIPAELKQKITPGALEDYYKFLQTIDIGLAPLADTAFNRSRSDVKFLEYAVSGVVPVVQDLIPYQTSVLNGETGFLFGNPGELVRVLDRLTGDKELMIRVAKRARSWVMKERLQQDHAGTRIDFYRQRLSEIGWCGKRAGETASLFEKFSAMEGAHPQGRHLRLMPTRFELLLHDGLVLAQVKENWGQARAYFSEASRLEPYNYLPYLFGAGLSEDTIASLERTLSLHPLSLKARVLLGEAHARKGNVSGAIQSFMSAAEIFPEYEIPYARVASLLMSLGDQQSAEDMAARAQALVVQ